MLGSVESAVAAHIQRESVTNIPCSVLEEQLVKQSNIVKHSNREALF